MKFILAKVQTFCVSDKTHEGWKKDKGIKFNSLTVYCVGKLYWFVLFYEM